MTYLIDSYLAARLLGWGRVVSILLAVGNLILK